MKLKTNSIKEPRQKIRNKKIRTEVEIPTTKRVRL
jgi:hypothetical protein